MRWRCRCDVDDDVYVYIASLNENNCWLFFFFAIELNASRLFLLQLTFMDMIYEYSNDDGLIKTHTLHAYAYACMFVCMLMTTNVIFVIVWFRSFFFLFV